MKKVNWAWLCFVCEQITKPGSLQGPIWSNIESVWLTVQSFQFKSPKVMASRELNEFSSKALLAESCLQQVEVHERFTTEHDPVG